ncbi:MAG: nitrilase-related carbon-nitrogen hydrolase [Gemmatimonadales bacterium]
MRPPCRVPYGSCRGAVSDAICGGTLARHHRKLMPTYHERLIWGMGEGGALGAVTVDGVTVGSLIGWEHWMPLTRQAMHDPGEEIHVAGWPGVQEMHQVASRSTRSRDAASCSPWGAFCG